MIRGILHKLAHALSLEPVEPVHVVDDAGRHRLDLRCMTCGRSRRFYAGAFASLGKYLRKTGRN
jgi:hypothetical protein